MDSTTIIVNLIGVSTIVLIIWYFWLWQGNSVTAQRTGGLQVIDVTVKGGYQPAAIVAKAGQPLQLNFTRREASLCGEEVVLPDFGKRVHLPENQTITVEVTPQQKGEYDFTCGMNMYRGKIIIE